jgi:hypothetical protein
MEASLVSWHFDDVAHFIMERRLIGSVPEEDISPKRARGPRAAQAAM